MSEGDYWEGAFTKKKNDKQRKLSNAQKFLLWDLNPLLKLQYEHIQMTIFIFFKFISITSLHLLISSGNGLYNFELA